MGFTRYPVGARTSVDSLFPPGGRRGIYVLEFENGERYVGLATDVVRRFSAHRRRWDDIVAIQFSSEPTAELAPIEREAIHRQQVDHRLRNKAFALGPPGPSPLDMTVTPSLQDAWLADDDIDERDLGDGVRSVSQARREAGEEAFARLRGRPNAVLAIDLLTAYVHAVVPRPKETEGRFWGVSAAPSTGSGATWRRLAALSVHSMETFVVGETPLSGRDDDWAVRGFVVVSRAELEKRNEADLVTLAAHYTPVLAFVRHEYESAGDDDISIHWVGTEESLAALDELQWVHAARVLTIRLMRKGLSLQRRWHNVPLADVILEHRPVAGGE